MEATAHKTPKGIPGYKSEFIDMLTETGALRFAKEGEDLTLKSGRKTTYFINMGDFNSGLSTDKLAAAYAALIAEKIQTLEKNGEPLYIYGIPEKGVALGPGVSAALSREHGIQSYWFFTRKEAKTHGESTNREDLAKSMIVGKIPPSGANVLFLDDVLTTGGAKYDELAKLGKLLDKPNYVGLIIGADRMEVDFQGKSAAEEFKAKTGIPVYSIVNSAEILDYARLRPDKQARTDEVLRTARYLRVYGTQEARRNEFVSVMKAPRTVDCSRSIIPACDMPTLEAFEKLVEHTFEIDGIGGYKIGFELGLAYGLPKVVETARKHTDKPMIYDHQKAGTDIPDTGKSFMRVLREAGVDSVILFPQAGSETERTWIWRALESGLSVMVGGVMTHPAYTVSEGGFIEDGKALEIYRIAARAGVFEFVVPGTKPGLIREVKDAVTAEGISAPIFYAPGLGAQGGKFEEVKGVLGQDWHAIVGRQIVNAKDGDYGKAARQTVEELLRD